MLGNYKIKVNNESESKEAQELFKQIGCGAVCVENNQESIQMWANGTITSHSDHDDVDDYFKELTLPQLRDMVVLHRNDVKDATHFGNYCGDFYVTCDGDIYSWEEPGAWEKDNYNTMNDIEPIQAQPAKQGLISGADAKLAWAKGEDVQYQNKLDVDSWLEIDGTNTLGIFEKPQFVFRLKPRTITLNVEIPAPFEPKVGETYYFITTSNSQGFDFTEFDDSDGDKLYMQLGAYRSALDASKAFEALRGALK